jgi:hypothetical protein
MRIYQREVNREESLTLGSNTENTQVKEANIYVVFINAVAKNR